MDISEERYKAGDIGEDDLLKMKLQMLQFQMDVSAAQLSRVQALSDLRQLLGYESVGPDYDVSGTFDYQAVNGNLDDFQAKALANRPDLQAARLGINAANSQLALQKSIGKRDVTGQVSYTHLGYTNDVSLFGQIQLPIFDRNQGEIARAGFAITQAQEQERFASGQVLTDVRDAFEGLHANDQIVTLYRSGYLDAGAAIPAISPTTPTSTAQRACLIFLMRSAAIGPRNSATARRWHRTCSRSNSFAKL